MYVYVISLTSIKHIHTVVIIEVHADSVMECRGILYYMYETKEVWGHAPQGKFEFLGETMLHLRPF